MNIEEVLEENRLLKQRLADIHVQVQAGINCSFFCALPECAKWLTGETHDKNFAGETRPQALERAGCTPRNEQGERTQMDSSSREAW